MNYWIVADICSDLPKTYVYAQERLTLMPMNYTMAGREYSYRVGDENRSDEFYQKIRGGEKRKEEKKEKGSPLRGIRCANYAG